MPVRQKVFGLLPKTFRNSRQNSHRIADKLHMARIRNAASHADLSVCPSGAGFVPNAISHAIPYPVRMLYHTPYAQKDPPGISPSGSTIRLIDNSGIALLLRFVFPTAQSENCGRHQRHESGNRPTSRCTCVCVCLR